MANELELKKHVARCFYLLSTLLKLAQDLQSAMQKKGISLDIAGGVLSFLLTKSLTTAEAVRELCLKGYCKDALVLVRTVFEAALWVLDIYRDKELAEEKATAYIMYEPVDRKMVLQKMLRLVEERGNTTENHATRGSTNGADETENKPRFKPTEDEFKEELKRELNKAEKEISRIREDYEVRDSLLNYGATKVRQLAHDVGLLPLYHSFYWESSLYAHNRPRSSISFMAESKTGWDFFWGPEGKGRDDVMLRLSQFLWYILREFNSYFELGQGDVISQKWQELEDLFGAALELRELQKT